MNFAEKQSILHVLKVSRGNKLEAARMLQIIKTSFYENAKCIISNSQTELLYRIISLFSSTIFVPRRSSLLNIFVAVF
ncbi:helix-turn-helix domain-containing protein [Bacillus methanolicus]